MAGGRALRVSLRTAHSIRQEPGCQRRPPPSEGQWRPLAPLVRLAWVEVGAAASRELDLSCSWSGAWKVSEPFFLSLLGASIRRGGAADVGAVGVSTADATIIKQTPRPSSVEFGGDRYTETGEGALTAVVVFAALSVHSVLAGLRRTARAEEYRLCCRWRRRRTSTRSRSGATCCGTSSRRRTTTCAS
eukprot:COSAG04_NODE_6682_length_1278_cov_217.912638_3_plen_189_part_00